jgi:hypothetical protein
MRCRILQYNTNDNFHGDDYFAKATTNVDYAFFQRLSIENDLSLLKKIHLEKSISGISDSLYVGVGRFADAKEFSSWNYYDLPSANIVKETNNKFQGSKAICTEVDRIILCSVLPCYPNKQDGGTITSKDTLEDIRFLLNKLRHTRCIIAGDFHHAPGDSKELEDLIKDNGFTSYLDNYDTFVKPQNGDKFNLDRMISNIPDLTVDNIKVHQPSKPSRHLAITYEINYS